MEVTNYQFGGEVRPSIENTEHDGERTSSNDRVPPSRFTTEDGMPNLPQDEHKQEEDAISLSKMEVDGPIIIRVAAAFISRRITSIESQSLMEMTREDFEAAQEAMDAAYEARKKLSSTYRFVKDRLAHAAFISRRITSIESQSLMEMTREDFEAAQEAMDAAYEARKKLSSTYRFVKDRLAHAHLFNDEEEEEEEEEEDLTPGFPGLGTLFG